MDSNAPKKNTSSDPEVDKGIYRTDVIKKTSFTLPSMSGFWKPDASQDATVPEMEKVVPAQEENSPPPTPASQPAWGWSTVEGARAADEKASVALAAQIAQETAKRRLLFMAIAVIVLIFLLATGTFAYVSNRAMIRHAAPVTVHHEAHVSVRSGGQASPTKSTANGVTDTGSGSGSRSFQVGAHPLIVIKGHGSDVNIHVGNMNTVVVVAKQHGTNNGTGVQYEQANDGKGHDRISVMTDPWNMNVDYDILVPNSTLVQIQVDNGSIDVEGISGVTINTGGGNLDIEDINGNINVYTENGDIKALNLVGAMRMEVGNGGSIRANNISGPLTAISHNGNVIVNGAMINGVSSLETNYGSVSLEGSIDTRGTYLMKTINGNIHLALPASASFQLLASVGSGMISNAFGSPGVGNIPRAQVTADVQNGSIVVNKAV